MLETLLASAKKSNISKDIDLEKNNTPQPQSDMDNAISQSINSVYGKFVDIAMRLIQQGYHEEGLNILEQMVDYEIAIPNILLYPNALYASLWQCHHKQVKEIISKIFDEEDTRKLVLYWRMHFRYIVPNELDIYKKFQGSYITPENAEDIFACCASIQIHNVLYDDPYLKNMPQDFIRNIEKVISYKKDLAPEVQVIRDKYNISYSLIYAQYSKYEKFHNSKEGVELCLQALKDRYNKNTPFYDLELYTHLEIYWNLGKLSEMSHMLDWLESKEELLALWKDPHDKPISFQNYNITNIEILSRIYNKFRKANKDQEEVILELLLRYIRLVAKANINPRIMHKLAQLEMKECLKNNSYNELGGLFEECKKLFKGDYELWYPNE